MGKSDEEKSAAHEIGGAKKTEANISKSAVRVKGHRGPYLRRLLENTRVSKFPDTATANRVIAGSKHDRVRHAFVTLGSDLHRLFGEPIINLPLSADLTKISLKDGVFDYHGFWKQIRESIRCMVNYFKRDQIPMLMDNCYITNNAISDSHAAALANPSSLGPCAACGEGLLISTTTPLENIKQFKIKCSSCKKFLLPIDWRKRKIWREPEFLRLLSDIDAHNAPAHSVIMAEDIGDDSKDKKRTFSREIYLVPPTYRQQPSEDRWPRSNYVLVVPSRLRDLFYDTVYENRLKFFTDESKYFV